MKVGWLLLAWFGHMAFWMACSNRISATGWAYPLTRALRKACYATLLGVPGIRVFKEAVTTGQASDTLVIPGWPLYDQACCLVAMVVLVQWWCRCWQWDARFQPLILERYRVRVPSENQDPMVQGRLARCLASLPINQVLTLEINHKQLDLPHWPNALDGLTITHVSDLHVSKHFSRDFYAAVIDQVNQVGSDVIALTGDLSDLDPVPDWVADLYGRLTAPEGVFFILGNHDLRKSQPEVLRESLVARGLVSLGNGRLVREMGGCSIQWCGNEVPWSLEVPVTPDARRCSIGLAHSPDQFRWAQQHQLDLLLAGHMHGGQICCPGLGPVVGPSWYGVTYSQGCFRHAGTTMHVTRGAGGLFPLRIACCPEITRLEIRCSR